MPDYHRAHVPGGTYFFTVNTYRRQTFLTGADVRSALQDRTSANELARTRALRSLEADIRSILTNDATVGEQTDYGQKLEVRGSITGPADRSAEIVTGWIILKGGSIPRFITAYPGD